MAKKRIHQIAKELDIASADVLFHAKELGFEVKTASSGLTEEEEELLKLALLPEDEPESESEVVQEQEETIQDAPKTEVEEVPEDDVQIIEISRNSSPEKISSLIDVDATQIVGDLMGLGIMKAIDTPLEDSDIEKLFEKYNLIPDLIDEITISREDIIEFQEFEDDPDKLNLRAPIITVMGHVDHGKTSLLDYIRNEKADIVVLVVAADDGEMPQTIEAINHSKAANVPIVVAINKCDLPEANPSMIKAELTKYEVISEDLGGDTPVVEVSALKGDGVDDLLETLALVAEIEELKANFNTNASGYIVESRMEVGRGNVATVIVTRGTLKQGDFLYAGQAFCRVKSMFDHNNKTVKSIEPGSPIDIIGWDESPTAGDQFVAVKNQKDAKAKAEENKTKLKEHDNSSFSVETRVSDMMKLLQEGELNTVNVILKADTNGSVEAIKDGINKLATDDVNIQVVHSAVGGIVLSDVDLASATESLIIGFNVRPDSQARNMAQSKGIDVRTYNIIYELLDDIAEAVLGQMTIKTEEAIIGMVDVKTTFRAPKVGVVAGSIVSEGKVELDAKARLLRDGVVIYEGTIVSLRRFKDNVEVVNEGLECGIGLSDYKDIKEGDTIEILGEVEV